MASKEAIHLGTCRGKGKSCGLQVRTAETWMFHDFSWRICACVSRVIVMCVCVVLQIKQKHIEFHVVIFYGNRYTGWLVRLFKQRTKLC